MYAHQCASASYFCVDLVGSTGAIERIERIDATEFDMVAEQVLWLIQPIRGQRLKLAELLR